MTSHQITVYMTSDAPAIETHDLGKLISEALPTVQSAYRNDDGDHPTWKLLMDTAYARFQSGDLKDLPMADFITSLGRISREAVCLGNLNYQWENGGLTQWICNRYASDHGLKNVIATLRTVEYHCEPGSEERRAAQWVGDIIEGSQEMIRDYDSYCNGPRGFGDEEDGNRFEDLEDCDKPFYERSDAFKRAVESYLTRQVSKV